jgi:hypothetical protein
MIDLTDGVPGVNAPEPASFEEFWPFYLSQHLHPITRAVHVAGTLTAWAVGLTGIARRKPLQVAIAPFFAYGPAFASHFIWEKNRPATLGGHVLWSARGDHRMIKKVLTGQVNQDVDAIRSSLGMEPGQVTLTDWERDGGVTGAEIEIPAAQQPEPHPVAAG